MNNGQWQISEAEAGMRLDRWLSSMRRLGSNFRAMDTLRRGRVKVNGARQTFEDGERLLKPGDVIRLWIDPPIYSPPEFDPSPFDFLNIVHEDRHLLATNKPAGLLTTPHPFFLNEESLFDMIEEYLAAKRRRPYIVHRIDRGTTGLTLVAKSLAAQELLKEQFARREPERIYRAITHGAPQAESGEWRHRIVWSRSKRHFTLADDSHPWGMEALSFFRILERFPRATLIEVRLFTGKRNQIRLQAHASGCPLLGERTFTEPALLQSEIPFPRQALHAYQLNFIHPVSQLPIRLEAPIPPDMLELIEKLREESGIRRHRAR